MSVESYLTRRLDIRFIDARIIVTEAKVNLKIHGYPTKDQELIIRREACRVYCNRSDADRQAMRQLSESLEAVKISKDSMHSDTSCCSSSCGDDYDSQSFAGSSSASTGTSGKPKRRMSLFRKTY